ncbi:hypothetical protein MKX03_000054 [Papaver bracteatum]|nr:hypothetical protein MKX03_000054 [Papaver bracteatum]
MDLEVLVFAIIGLSMALQMESGTAITCDLGETIVTGKESNRADCRSDAQTKCGLQGRVVSHLECNYWDPNHTGDILFEGCCQVPLPCPSQPPVDWKKCPATDTDKTFSIQTSNRDCRRCQDGCKTKCDAIGARVGDQICGYLTNGQTKTGLYCVCCCRKKASLPPPLPPSLSPPPPPPPSPTPEKMCRFQEIYVAFELSYPYNCNSCRSDCAAKCSGLGSFLVTEQCIAESSSSLCKCCCSTPPRSRVATAASE